MTSTIAKSLRDQTEVFSLSVGQWRFVISEWLLQRASAGSAGDSRFSFETVYPSEEPSKPKQEEEESAQDPQADDDLPPPSPSDPIPPSHDSQNDPEIQTKDDLQAQAIFSEDTSLLREFCIL
jgi:hypothetical protein